MNFHPRGSRPGQEIIAWEAIGLQNKSGILIEVPLEPKFSEVIDEIIRRYRDDEIVKYPKPIQVEEDVKYVFIITQNLNNDYIPNGSKLLSELHEVGARIADEPLYF